MINLTIKQFLRKLIKRYDWFGNFSSCNSDPEWEYVRGGWQDSVRRKSIKGWDLEDVAKASLKNWPVFIESITAPEPFGFSNEAMEKGKPDLNFHNNVMNFAYALSIASKGNNKISLLDWGGGIGCYYKIAKSLFPELEIEYTIKDLPKLCEAGRKINQEVRFVTNEKDCLNQKYDLVVASSSLHYSKDWQRVLDRLIRCAKGYVFITRLPIIEYSPSYVVIQRAYKYGYNTEYFGWHINKKEFLSATRNSGAVLERIFLCAEKFVVPGAPELAYNYGFLFKYPGDKG